MRDVFGIKDTDFTILMLEQGPWPSEPGTVPEEMLEEAARSGLAEKRPEIIGGRQWWHLTEAGKEKAKAVDTVTQELFLLELAGKERPPEYRYPGDAAAA